MSSPSQPLPPAPPPAPPSPAPSQPPQEHQQQQPHPPRHPDHDVEKAASATHHPPSSPPDASLHSDETKTDRDGTKRRARGVDPGGHPPPSRRAWPLALAVARHAAQRVETVGIAPVAESQRNSTQWWGVGLIWFSANTNVLCFSGGTLAPTLGLGMGAAMASIVLFSALLSLPPAYLSIFGKHLGMRQMVSSRYSWGYFPVMVVCALNAVSMVGYAILNTILGGQTLSATAATSRGGSHLTPTVGIVVAAVVGLVLSFSGLRLLHVVDRWFWLPVLVGFVVLVSAAGTGPEGLHVPAQQPPPSSSAVLGMGAVLAGFLVSWSPLASDYTYQLSPRVASWKLCLAVFLGFFLSTAPCFMLGAAFAISAADIPAWSDALAVSNGELFNVVLSGPNGVGGFGKFIQVLLALSVIGNLAVTFYSFGLTFQTMLPFLTHTPRFLWPALAFAVILPLAIVGQSRFYAVLTNFTSVLSYWSALYLAVVLAEHLVVRRADFSRYDARHWDRWRELPLGVSALAASCASLALVVPSMQQAWFTGPVAAKVGDVGFEVGFALCFLLYVPLRLVEKRWVGR